MKTNSHYPTAIISKMLPLQKKVNKAGQLRNEIEIRIKELNELFPPKQSFIKRFFNKIRNKQ